MAPTISGYNYYAGYSLPFVHSVFDYFQLPTGACVLDPWNGSGATTRVAKWRKINSIGFDLNPATLVIARAGLIDWNTIVGSVQPLSEHLLEQTQQILAQKSSSPQGSEEPFNQWFTPTTSGVLRNLELTVRATLVGLSSAQTTQFSPLAAFFYLALFRMARDLTKPFCGSNPTWIKTAISAQDRLNIPAEDIYVTFQCAINELSHSFAEWDAHQAANNVKNPKTETSSDVRLDVADSRYLPLPDKSVDAVITSPPYCTRIDYVVAMLPELAVIGVSVSEAKLLKRRLLGTNTVLSSFLPYQMTWGKACRKLLQAIKKHPSRASDTYYLKWATQYFDSLYNSLREINRVLKPNSFCAIVVQDSHYKDVKIDLPLIVCEMASTIKWAFAGQSSYTGKSTMANVNPKVKIYRNRSSAEECVLVFKTNK